MQKNIEIENFSDIKIFCEKNKYWNIPEDEAAFIHKLIIERGYKKILEYGSGAGYSTLWLADAASKNGGSALTIESNRQRYEIAKKNFQSKRAGKYIEIILGHCPECLGAITGLFDFIFMDIVKLHYIDAFKESIRLLEKGGIIAADNILTHKKETSKYIEYINSLKNCRTEIYDKWNGLAVSYF